jgi:hypothetical protein
LLSFFRVNDPYRLIGVIVILFLIRFAFLINPDFIFVQEIKWLLLGEKISQGNLLYKEVWDTTAPFSALAYGFVDLLFGKSLTAYRIIALGLTFFYSLYFSRILINNNIYLEKTYVPAIVFSIFNCLFIDLFTLTTPLLGLAFILLSLDYMFKLLDKGLQDNQFYNIGFLIGIAALFYLPYATFLIFAMFTMFLYSNTSLRKYLLTVLGFLFPYLILFIFYSLYYGLDNFYYMYIISFLTIDKYIPVGIENQILLIIVPVLLVVLAMGKLLVAPRFVNYQQKTQQMMFFYLITAGLSYFLIVDINPSHLVLAIPGFTFFATHYFLLIRKKLFSELSFLIFMGAVPVLTLGISSGTIQNNWIDYKDMLVSLRNTDEINHKKIVVLGNDVSPYVDNSLATPYLNWNLSKNHFERLKYFEVVLAAYKNFKGEMPEYIIDQTKSTPKLFAQIPAIGNNYEKCGENIYCLKDKRASSNQKSLSNKNY